MVSLRKLGVTTGVTTMVTAAFLNFGGTALANDADAEVKVDAGVASSETTTESTLDVESLLEDFDLSVGEVAILQDVLDDVNVNIEDINVDALRNFLNDNNVVLSDVLNDNELLNDLLSDNDILSGVLLGGLLG
jgi:hypothetical protein